MSDYADEPHVEGASSRRDVQDPSFERLLTFLKESRAFDFTGYKRRA